MNTFRKDIWEDGEYTYKAAYGFVPNIRAFIHDDDENRDCMLVVPGGGYCMVVPPEAQIVAEEFYSRGMNTFVLTYTTDITFAVPLKMQPLNDISRAVRVLRANAKEYKIDGRKLVVCGFSAGAHVCGSLCTHWQDVKDVNPKYADISNRPDGGILSYPVITTGEYTHIYSVQALLGQNPSKEELDYFSLEKQVSDKTPPCFIWQTREDNLVPVENSYLFAESMKAAGVPYAHYVFPYGFHGLSIASEGFFRGDFPDKFTCEQLDAAVEAVLSGKGIDVSEQRVEEMRQQFGEGQMQPEQGEVDLNPYPEVRFWPSMAMEWINML